MLRPELAITPFAHEENPGVDEHEFSIIVPTYNRLEYLQQALSSIWCQTLSAYEIIVVDDGSTDGTWSYLESLGERVRAFRQENLGPARARNRGIDVAVGRYIAFLDSDDIWFPWTLESFQAAIRYYQDPTLVSAAHLDFVELGEASSVERGKLKCTDYPDYISSCADHRWLGVPGTVVRSSALRDLRFVEKDINAEDHDFWLRLGDKPGFVFIHSPFQFAYRRHDDSRTSQVLKSFAGAAHLIASEKAGRYPGGERRKAERLTIIGRHVRPVMVACARNAQAREALELWLATFFWNLRELRLRALLGLPVLIVAGYLRRMISRMRSLS